MHSLAINMIKNKEEKRNKIRDFTRGNIGVGRKVSIWCLLFVSVTPVDEEHSNDPYSRMWGHCIALCFLFNCWYVFSLLLSQILLLKARSIVFIEEGSTELTN